MKTSASLFTACILLSISTFTFASNQIDLDKWGSVSSPLILDLSTQTKISFIAQSDTTLNVTVKNLLPTRRGLYNFKFGSKPLVPELFVVPKISEAIENEKNKRIDNKIVLAVKGICEIKLEELMSISATIYTLEKEVGLPKQLEQLNQLTLSTPSHCLELHKLTKELIDQTQQSYSLTVQNNTEYSFSVHYLSDELASLTITEPATEWLTHVGMTFFENKDKIYFSEKINTPTINQETEEETDMASYQIAYGADRGGMDYAATVIFTYPLIHKIANKEVDFGLSVGVGADNSTITALIGLSLVINHNFVATLGLIGTEFDVLKSQYDIGDDLGESAIDSTNLVKQTYKFSPMLTLSYKFGGE